MCMTISPDLVVGNILIEAIENDSKNLEIEEIIKFERHLNSEFKAIEYDCYSDILLDDIYYVMSVFDDIFSFSNGNISISVEDEQKPTVLESLIRFFRIGLPTIITELFQKTYTCIFGNNAGEVYE